MYITIGMIKSPVIILLFEMSIISRFVESILTEIYARFSPGDFNSVYLDTER